MSKQMMVPGKQLRGLTGKGRWLFRIVVAAVVLMAGCGEKVPEEPAQQMPDSFSYMEIGANTIINKALRERLQEALGFAAVDQKTTIYLDLKNKGFLEKYFADLHGLNRQLNGNDVVRKEHAATRISFRNTRKKQSLFDYVELTYETSSHCPLLFKFRSRNNLQELIKSVTQKYGQPAITSTEEGKGEALRWQRNGDVFIIARFPGRLDKAEYHMMIVYANRIDQMLAAEAREEQQKRAVQTESERKLF